MANIYHITHITNLPSILEQGGLYCDSTATSKKLRPTVIGYSDLKERRSRVNVGIPPGGNLSHYVPFYFAPRSPMLFVISKGGVPGYNDGQKHVLHLVTSTEQVAQSSIQFVFTDGHAYMAISKFFNDLDYLSQVDRNIMQARYWSDTLQDGDRSRRRSAEFLVYDFLPWSLIEEIGVMNKRVESELRGMMQSAVHQPQINVRQQWYY